jgi:hypothetical protein
MSNPVDSATDNGYICPRGYYCDPELSITEIACPKGTYNAFLGMGTIEDCLTCSVGYYQSSTGNAYCIECGNGAWSNEGDTECYCKKAKKLWVENLETGKNYCRPRARYTSDTSSNTFIKDSKKFNDVDSVPKMCNPTCASGEFCNPNTDTCESTSCPTSCPNGDGEYDSTLGLCQCSGDTSEEACDSACQAAKSTMSYDSGLNKFCCDYNCLVLGVAQEICLTADQLGMYFEGSLNDETISILSPNSGGGMSGIYQCPQQFFDAAVVGTVPSCATDLYARRRNLEDGDRRDLVAAAVTYSQTLICLTSSETTVTWEVSATSFPTYNKDHPLNDDYDFDDSSFVALETKLVGGGVSFSTFTYSFSSISDEIAIAFDDYSNPDKITVVALNRDTCANPVMPLTKENLELVGISEGAFLSLGPMEKWLILFPILFLFGSIGFAILLKMLEIRHHKIQLRKAIESQQKEFIREDGSVDRIQYLKDLYNVIKHYLGEMGDKDPVKAIVDSENNEVDRREQNEAIFNLEQILREFFDDLRFVDGELVEEKAQVESTDETENEVSQGEGEDNEDHDEEYNSNPDQNEAEGEEDSEEGDPIDLDKLLMNDEDKIEEVEETEENDMPLNLGKDMERDKREFIEGLNRLGLSEEEKRQLIDKYEDSLRRARDMIEGDAAAQAKARQAKLEERKNKKQEARFKIRELEEQENDINNKFKDKIMKIDDEIDERVANINDELLKEEEEQRRELDRKFKERMKKSKHNDEFYAKIKGQSGNNQKRLIADYEKENERLIKDLERERAYNEKKMIKERGNRKKEKILETTKDMNEIKKDILKDQAKELEEIERKKLLICAEYGLEDEFYPKNKNNVDKDQEEDRKTNHIKEIELLRLKQRQRFEKKLIEDIVPEEEEVQNLEDEIDKQREEFKNRIANAGSQAERDRLTKELEDEKENEWAEELERQRQIQEQALFEKKKRRQLYKERNNFKLNSKHREENLNKELELMAFDAYKREEEWMEKIDKLIEKETGNKDLPLKVYKMLEDMTSQRLDDQAKIQFYEISGRLSNLYTDIAFDRALAKKNLEEDMNDKVKDLDSRNVPSNEFQKETNNYQKELDRKGKEQDRELNRRQLEGEMNMRSKLSEEHSNAKKKLEEDLYEKKQKVLSRLGKDFRNEGILKHLVDRSREDLEEKLLKIAEEREQAAYKNELKLVARTNKDLARMEKQLEEDLDKEKEKMKAELRKRRNKVLKDLKQKYVNELKTREDLTKDQQDVLLKKKYEEEMARFEAALAKESKEQQFRRLREKLILKRLEAEKDKELKRREARINKQMKDEDSDDDGRRKREKKGKKGKKASLLRQLTDAMSERMESEYGGSSLIPRKHKMNLNVMLRGFKDSVADRQKNKEKPGMAIQRKATRAARKQQQEEPEVEKKNVFDELCNLYMRYRADDNADDEPAFKRLQTDEVTVRSDGTISRYNGEVETTRLLRRIIRVEKISSALSESKVQQVINDLNQLSAILMKKK